MCVQSWKRILSNNIISLCSPKTMEVDERKYQALPQYQPCPILSKACQLFLLLLQDDDPSANTSGISKEQATFVKRLLRDGSLEARCMVVTMNIVRSAHHDNHHHNHNDTNHNQSIPFVSPTTLSAASTSIITFNNKEEDTKNNVEDDDDDEHNWCLQEGWTWIQDVISWNDCRRLFHYVVDRVQFVTVPHPLYHYSTKTLFQLTDEEFDDVRKICQTTAGMPTIANTNRLRASQHLLDYIAQQPDRMIGILFDGPHLEDESPPSNKLPVWHRSCLANCTLEVTMVESSNRTQFQCDWIALYDLEEDEIPTIGRGGRRSPVGCACVKCLYEKNPSLLSKYMSENSDTRTTSMVLRLAHDSFQQEKYSDAKQLYHLCHSAYRKLGDISKAADVWHTIGAVELAQNHFVTAQEHWRNSRQQPEQYSDAYQRHEGIALQLEKQEKYQYFEPLMSRGAAPLSELPYESWGSNLFVTHDMVTAETCQQLIDWALEHVSHQGGWTTSRHYAVPTTDVPVHQVPQLLKWFQNWMDHCIHPLLERQFRSSPNQRYYVHDAFLVRYQGSDPSTTTSSSTGNFLPLHYDESTHSMVLALNDNFEGGGTYVFNLDKTVTPRQGSLVSFAGNRLLHGGNVVTKGVRYILAVFMYLDKDVDGWKGDQFNTSVSQRRSLHETFREAKRQKISGFSFGFSV